MITSNFIHRIFRIKCGEFMGTGFTIDVDGKQYVVTAKHVVNGFSPHLLLKFLEMEAGQLLIQH